MRGEERALRMRGSPEGTREELEDSDALVLISLLEARLEPGPEILRNLVLSGEEGGRCGRGGGSDGAKHATVGEGRAGERERGGEELGLEDRRGE